MVGHHECLGELARLRLLVERRLRGLDRAVVLVGEREVDRHRLAHAKAAAERHRLGRRRDLKDEAARLRSGNPDVDVERIGQRLERAMVAVVRIAAHGREKRLELRARHSLRESIGMVAHPVDRDEAQRAIREHVVELICHSMELTIAVGRNVGALRSR